MSEALAVVWQWAVSWIHLLGVSPVAWAELLYVALSVVGQEFIAKRDWRGFYAWMVSNVCAAVVFIDAQRWMAVLLTGYFLWKSIVGLRTWKRLDESAAGRSLGRCEELRL